MRSFCRKSACICVIAVLLLQGVQLAVAEPAFVRVPEGGLQPQLVRDAEGTLHLLYFSGEAAAGDLFYTRRPPRTDAFAKPIQVNSQSESAIATGTIRGGRLALGRNGRVHVLWNGSGKAEPRGPEKYDSPLLYSRFDPTAGQFEPQRNLIGEAQPLDGGSSVAADERGNVYVVWHAGRSEPTRRVWLARSSDDGATFASETAIDSDQLGVCGCCSLNAFADREGDLFVLYRSAREKVNRDMQLLLSTRGKQPFSDQRLDTWQVAVCPMSSGSFAESQNAVYAAWETNGQVKFARIDKESGRAGAAIIPTGTAPRRKHPALATNEQGNVFLVWTEGTDWQKGGSLAWQEFDAKGKPTRVRGRREGIPVWGFAATVATSQSEFLIIY